jgi:hypothetical protein
MHTLYSSPQLVLAVSLASMTETDIHFVAVTKLPKTSLGPSSSQGSVVGLKIELPLWHLQNSKFKASIRFGKPSFSKTIRNQVLRKLQLVPGLKATHDV